MSSAPPADEPWHGSDAGYTRHACRCALCKRAHRDAVWAYRQQRAADGRPVRRRPQLAFPQPNDWVKHPRLGWGVVLRASRADKQLVVRHRRDVVRTYRARIITGHHGPNGQHNGGPANGGPESQRRELDLEKLVQLRERGWTYTELAVYFGVSASTVARRLRR